MAKILLTGGTGLIGSHLAALLQQGGHSTAILSRKKAGKDTFAWDPARGYLDVAALDGVDVIVHLAGASIAGGRWTSKYKRKIADSRVKSTRFLYEKLKENKTAVKAFISASAIGIYGNTGELWVDENRAPATDFLGDTCRQWEAEAEKVSGLGMRVVIVRTGLVLASDGGLLPVMARPVKWCVGAALGDGEQYLSWIHMHDLCRIYQKVVEDPSLIGTYNATAPEPSKNRDFMKALASTYHRPFWPINVPGWFLKLLLGEKGELVTQGQRVSSKKVAAEGFEFEFTRLDGALKNLSQRRKDAKEKR